jgi:uncharacterized membrane protein
MPVRWQPIVLVLAAGACATVVLVTADGSPARVLAACLLALVFPGAAIVEGWAGDLGAVEALLLALGASIVVLILDSALLYVLGVRLELASWAWSLEAVTVLGAVLGSLRRAARDGPPVPGTPSSERARSGFAVASISAALVAGALAGAVLITQHSVVQRTRSDHFTQLWALPASSGAGRITVGLFNHQGRSLRYHVELRRRDRLLSRMSVRLGSGKRWTSTVTGLPHRGPIRIVASTTGPRPLFRWVQIRLLR